jgi:hypothetical protein
MVGTMYLVYNNSRFVTRLYIKDDSEDIEDALKRLLDQHNSFRKTNLQRKDLTVKKEENFKQPEKTINISLFKEFKYLEQLRNRIENLPFPKGLQVTIEQATESVKDTDKTRQRSLPIYESNMKLLYLKDDEGFARGVAKWLMLEPSVLNAKCTYKSGDRIIMECTLPAETDTLSKQERWGPLFEQKQANPKKGRFSKNCEIRVYSQFQFNQYFKDCIKGVTFISKGVCKFDSVGRSTVQLGYTLRNGEPLGEKPSLDVLRDYILKTVKIPRHTLVSKSSSWINSARFTSKGLKCTEYYLVVIDVEPEEKVVNNFRIENEDQLDQIIEEGLSLMTLETIEKSSEIDDEQLEIQMNYAKDISMKDE